MSEECSFTTEQIARTIDHALLHPTMSTEQIIDGCQLAKKLNLMSVCVKPFAVKKAAEILEGSNTAVGTVIGFPSGSHSTSAKAAEAKIACEDGAAELDMVINVGKALEEDWVFVKNDIAEVQKAAKTGGALLKVIFETDYVSSKQQITKLCEICNELKVDFVKTSTGFGFVKGANGYGYQGATEEAIRTMREVSDDQVGVKASGGIRSREDAEKFLALGCTRLGTSASVAILEGGQGQGY